MKPSWQDMKGMLLLPHVSCKTSGNCIHVSYTNTRKWDSLFQGKDTQKDILKNCYPHPLWNFTILSTVWNSETKNIGKTPGRRRRGESNLFADVEKNRERCSRSICADRPRRKALVLPYVRAQGFSRKKKAGGAPTGAWCVPVLCVEAGGGRNRRC